jgi:hypothetical protein
MPRKLYLLLVPIVLCSCVYAATRQPPEIYDPDQAKSDPDFAIQGEYVGADGANKLGAQVVALGRGEFDVLFYKGGLPGDGWKKSDAPPATMKGKRDGETTKLQGKDGQGEIAGGTMTIAPAEGAKLTLKRTERKSPTLGAKPPAEAVVLFGGTSGEKFIPTNLLTKWNTLDSGGTTKDKFGDYSLHLEFRLSWMPEARGQARSNSGVYIHNCYEIQVLDSFGLEGKNDECGGFYQKKAPDVNMCFPPMTWQTYDVDFTAPKYEGNKKTANARITVKHNGVAIHDNYELPGDTPGADKEGPAPRPIELQGHGNHVQYQNVWLVEKK